MAGAMAGGIQDPAQLDEINLTLVSVVCIVMIGTGLVGGYVNFLLGDIDIRTPNLSEGKLPLKKLPWYGYLITGVVASFIVPLFLSLAKSDLLKTILEWRDTDRLIDLFILAGFCLVAAISSRTFIGTISDKILALARQASQTAAQASRTVAEVKAEQQSLKAEVKGEQQSLQREVDEVAEIAEGLSSAAELAPTDDGGETAGSPPIQLTSDQLRVLKALTAKSYSWRTPTGIATDSKLPLYQAKVILDDLIVNQKLVAERKSERTGKLLYTLTPRGAAILNEQLDK